MVSTGIILTSSMRSNLSSLNVIAAQMDKTQNILSTGKKVNSAIDNASSYYQARSLSNRAADLNSLLDDMGKGIQVLQAANEGLESATAYLEQMKSVAEQAATVEAKPLTSQVKLVDNSAELINEGYIGVSTEKELYYALQRAQIDEKIVLMNDIDVGSGFDSEFTSMAPGVTINGGGHTLTLTNTVLRFDGPNVTLENINIDSNNANPAPTIAFAPPAEDWTLRNVNINYSGDVREAVICSCHNGNIENVNINVDVEFTASPLIRSESSNGKDFNIKNLTMDISVVEIGCKSIAVSTNGGNVNIDGMSIKSNADYNIGVYNGRAGAIISADDINKAYGMIKSEGPDVSFYQEEFDKIISEYDKLISDVSYQGINLLTGGELKVTFNESRTNDILIKGQDIRSEKIGLNKADWDDGDKVKESIKEVQNSIEKLRNFADSLGNNYQVIQTRQNFTEALSDVLEEGADKLILADMNEASAEYLMLQTRQQLAVNSLSLASQSASSILSLF